MNIRLRYTEPFKGWITDTQLETPADSFTGFQARPQALPDLCGPQRLPGPEKQAQPGTRRFDSKVLKKLIDAGRLNFSGSAIVTGFAEIIEPGVFGRCRHLAYRQIFRLGLK